VEEDEHDYAVWVCHHCDYDQSQDSYLEGPVWGLQARPSSRPALLCPACRGVV
jgi:predicted hydrolase (HD superfamily)